MKTNNIGHQKTSFRYNFLKYVIVLLAFYSWNTNIGTKRMYPCNSCDKIYASPRTLQIHAKKIHGISEKIQCTNSHQCDICQKTFRTPTYLKHHASIEHGVEGDFGCKVCDKQFQISNIRST